MIRSFASAREIEIYNLDIFNRRTRITRIFKGIAGIVRKVWVIFRKPHSFSITQLFVLE